MKHNLTAWQSIAMKLPLLALLLVVGGCATCGHIVEDLTRAPRSRDSLIYAGTKYHLHEIQLYRTRNRTHWASQLSYSFRWWHYIDLPLCVCADTLLLPYTAPRTLYSHWRAQPTREEIAIRPHMEEYSRCRANLIGLEGGKLLYLQQHGLGPTDSVPQDLDVYRAQMDHPWNQGPFYVCPADGTYVVGGQNEDPTCSVHGTASQAMQAMEYMYKEKRLPESRRGCHLNDHAERSGEDGAGDRPSSAAHNGPENKTRRGDGQ